MIILLTAERCAMNENVAHIATALKNLNDNDDDARTIFDWFARRKRNSAVTIVRRAAEKTRIEEAAIRRVFGELEKLECGSLKIGRKGYETRMVWDLSILSIGAAAKGRIKVDSGLERLEDIEDEEEEAQVISHVFRLRPDFDVSLNLPADFSPKEADRLGAFLKSIPIN